jgi:hypothetical protein
MMNEAVRTGRERRVVQMPMRVLRQCLRFALYLSIKSVRMWLPQQYVPSSKLLEIVEPWRRGLGGCSIPDRVTSSQSDPLRNRSVLLLGSGELLLRAEGLVALLNASSASILQIFLRHPPPSTRPWNASSISQSMAPGYSLGCNRGENVPAS